MEYWCNTSFHSAAGISPFGIIYGRSPPSTLQFLSGETRAEAVAQSLANRDESIHQFQYHLTCVQQRMHKNADKHWHKVQFRVGEFVFLNLTPHRQTLIAQQVHQKLAAHYYGPFKILNPIGEVAYKLDLPPSTRIHLVFNVSKLKRVVDNHRWNLIYLLIWQLMSLFEMKRELLLRHAKFCKRE